MKSEIRPTCLNHGCERPVAWCGTRWRPVCSRCHKAGYDANTTYAPGVTPFRTGKCSNQAGHLGFLCPIDYSKTSWVLGSTQIDHIDGNHLNNVVENCQELCDLCHKEKGKRNGDFKIQKKYRYKREKVAEMC